MKDNKGKNYTQINSQIIQQIKIKSIESKVVIKFEKEDIVNILLLNNFKLKFLLRDDKDFIVDFKTIVMDELTTDLAIPLYNSKYFKKAKASKDFDLSWPNGLIIPIDNLLQFIF